MPDSLGTFSDDPQATWLVGPASANDPANRDMQLLRDFWFQDPTGTT